MQTTLKTTENPLKILAEAIPTALDRFHVFCADNERESKFWVGRAAGEGLLIGDLIGHLSRLDAANFGRVIGISDAERLRTYFTIEAERELLRLALSPYWMWALLARLHSTEKGIPFPFTKNQIRIAATLLKKTLSFGVHKPETLELIQNMRWAEISAVELINACLAGVVLLDGSDLIPNPIFFNSEDDQ